MRHHFRTSGVAFPFVLERLSKTLQHALKRMPVLSRVRPVVGKRWGGGGRQRLGVGRSGAQRAAAGEHRGGRTSGVAF